MDHLETISSSSRLIKMLNSRSLWRLDKKMVEKEKRLCWVMSSCYSWWTMHKTCHQISSSNCRWFSNKECRISQTKVILSREVTITVRFTRYWWTTLRRQGRSFSHWVKSRGDWMRRKKQREGYFTRNKNLMHWWMSTCKRNMWKRAKRSGSRQLLTKHQWGMRRLWWLNRISSWMT
jgi:hypothetical protein